MKKLLSCHRLNCELFTLPQTNPPSPILADSLIDRTPSPPASRSISSTSRSANKSNRSNKSNKSSTSSTTTPLVSRSNTRSSTQSNSKSNSSLTTPLVSRSTARSSRASSIATGRSVANSTVNSSLADISIGSPNSPPISPVNSPVASPANSTVNSPVNSLVKSAGNSPKRLSSIVPNEELINNENDYESIEHGEMMTNEDDDATTCPFVSSPAVNPTVELDNPVITNDNIDPVEEAARVSTPSTSRLTTLIEKVASTPVKITTPRKSLSGVSSARVSTSSTIQPTTLTPTRISSSSRPKRFLKNKRIQTWRGERPIYVPLENGCYKIIGTSAPHTPDFMKRKKRVTLKRKKMNEPKEKDPEDQVDVSETFVEKSDTTKEKLSKIFLNRENLNWKKLKVHKNLEHASLIKSKEDKQIVGYFRFIEKCNKPVNKTGKYLQLYILMEGSIAVTIEDEPPVLIKKLDPVIIPPETNYSMENMIDGESILLFAIL
ncbi:uncharacterized protein LOC128393180 [Panonychus citri]|uniref:uncharacterized protein LOC128393180 n=1 Tax=Panonychus citri TaxID=50023 RepID=UPI0023082493|nr:uncharacterized protein LOC128393180 [Panonychus citri]